MNEILNTILEALRIITAFFSDNLIKITLLVLIVICRVSISDFISRTISFTFRRGNSELAMEAVNRRADGSQTKELLEAEEELSSKKDEKVEFSDKTTMSESWYSEMQTAFDEGMTDEAEKIFNRYALKEADPVKLDENKALYLYFKFKKGGDNSALHELEDLARIAKTEDSKITIILFISMILSDGMQYKKEVELWRKAVQEIEESRLITDATIYLSYALNRNDSPEEAKRILIDRLKVVKEEDQKASLYSTLSTIESSLGNKITSIYCMDKSTEFDANNRDMLFNSAYEAGNERIDEISIGNYIKLLSIDSHNDSAINNLGVRAQKAGLYIIAVDNYKHSSEYNNTLSMANQGFLFLENGFTLEAEEIANRALSMDNTHKNIHNLISAINDKRDEQEAKWKALKEKALNRQKAIREYMDQYYLGDHKALEGDWFANNSLLTHITISDNTFKTTWTELSGILDGRNSYSVELSGVVSGSTFTGKYKRKKSDGNPVSLSSVAGERDVSCIGYLSSDGKRINIISSELKEDFSLYLSKHRT